jgi:cytochrome c
MAENFDVSTPQMLDDLIADTQKLVPANRMPYSGMPNPADRADLITYLEKATK